MTERTFHDAGGVLVTSARVEGPRGMYATRLITSVRVRYENQYPLAFLLSSAGAGILWVASSAYTADGGVLGCGALTSLTGLLVAFLGRGATVVLTTAGGETRAFTSRDRRLVEDVARAVKHAIVHVSGV